ncbi:hypothetical protein IC757_11590 [Wenzhouxiangella sp. AB-CW3]|uniref:hypothetical protein n=1 Tax=Wenzhouxiangella sp. AB-CW3 TaxID=2771012 RepID=UPI00168B983C|nr:hypothetical protein [Wenzhouxiangella sp. AB-CW3]QOC21681.1 hypothetical protein IC757_11590 [Wenzhouxiangella sp. AB-CW3]
MALKVNFVSEEGDVESTLNVYLHASASWALSLTGDGHGGAIGSIDSGRTLAGDLS